MARPAYGGPTEARIGEKAVVIEQTITLEGHYSDAD